MKSVALWSACCLASCWLAVGYVNGQAQAIQGPPETNVTALRIQGFKESLHVLIITIANITKAEFEGAPPGTTQPPMTTGSSSSNGSMDDDGPESVQEKLSRQLATGLHRYCGNPGGNSTACGLIDNTTLLNEILPADENILYLNANTTEDTVQRTLTVYAIFKLPSTPGMDLRLSPSAAPFILGSVMEEAVMGDMTIYCQGFLNLTFTVVSYQTPGGTLQSGTCPPPTTQSPTTEPATTVVLGTGTTQAVAATTFMAAVTTPAPTPVVITSLAPTTGQAVVSTVLATGPPQPMTSPPRMPSTDMMTDDPDSNSTDIPSTDFTNLQPVAEYDVSGVSLEQFRQDIDMLVAIAEGIITTNCTGDGGGAVGLELSPIAISNTSTAITFTLAYRRSQTTTGIDCSSIGGGTSLGEQLSNYFETPDAIQDLQNAIMGSTLRSISTQAPSTARTTTAASSTVSSGDSGLSTGAVVGIAVGSVVGVALIVIIVVALLQFGTASPLKKTASVMRVMPADPESGGKGPVKEAWGGEPHEVQESNA